MSADADRDARLARALRPYLSEAGDAPGGVLLAVSGGPDSTALMHMAARAGASIPVFVATVDHALRPESATEAAAVAALATRLGLPHRVLTWASPRHGSGLQEAARAARYDLLVAQARAVGAGTLLTAHTADDQAETVLMRLLAGSGPAGLAGMRRERPLADGVRLGRPFLDIPKAELVAYCEAHRLPVSRDPSNADARFARSRLRQLLPALAEEGLTTARLCRLAERLARDEAALAGAAASVLVQAQRPSTSGCVNLEGARLAGEPEAIALRVIDAALDSVAPGEAAPRRLQRLERLVLDGLLPALASAGRFRATLRGVLIEARADGTIRLARAPPRGRPVARHSSPQGSLVAAPSDLLGKGEAAAYIGGERTGRERVE